MHGRVAPVEDQRDWVVGLLDDVCPLDRGLLVMLKVYLDLGQKSDPTDEILTVAAAVFDSTGYRAFVKPWNLMLSDWPAPAFHATDFYPGGAEFWRKRPNGTIDPIRKERYDRHSHIVPHMIAQYATYLIAVGFRPREYLEVASPTFKANYGLSLHSMATQLILVLLGWWAKENNYTDGFACFMESGDEDEVEVLRTITNMRHDKIVGPHIQVTSINSVNKGKARGLEAADCLAWHWNKYYMDKIRTGNEDKPRIDLAKIAVLSENKHFFSFMTGDKLTDLINGAPESSSAYSLDASDV